LKKIIITIDGKVATGKTTITKQLSQKINASCIYSGKLYRLFTLYLFKKYLTWEKILLNLKEEMSSVEFVFEEGNFLIKNFFYNENELFSNLVMQNIHYVAQKKEIRTYLNDYFKLLIKNSKTNLIIEGRDAGTVIFPKADYKFFLDVSDEEAAKRRMLQLQKKQTSLKKLNDIKRENDNRNKDDKDASIIADDAIKIDTTFLTKEQVLDKIFKIIKKVENYEK